MGAPVSKIEAAEEPTAEALLSAFRHMEAAERRRHASVFNYWLSIRRNRELPPIRDLDPLEISDVAPFSVLLELTEGGEDAEIRHMGETLKGGVSTSRLSEAPTPSTLSSIAGKLGLIAISRNALAFEDTFPGEQGTTRCCVTLLPFSTDGTTVDFVYGLVGVETGVTEIEDSTEPDDKLDVEDQTAPDAVTSEPEEASEEPAPELAPEELDAAPEAVGGESLAAEDPVEAAADNAPEPIEEELQPLATEPGAAADASTKPGFSKIFDALAGAKGFFGSVASAGPEPVAPPLPEVQPEAPETMAEEPESVAHVPEAVAEEHESVAHVPEAAAEEPEAVAHELEAVAEEREALAEEPEAAAEEPQAGTEEPEAATDNDFEKPNYPTEGTLQTKLAEVRSKADEARAAKLRAETALVDGLSAAYDFALDAEGAPEEYLKLVEEQGLKIQLRSPMKPVVKLAFDGYCDGATITDLEAVLAWALKMDLPRGSLAERIEAEGGIAGVLGGQKRAA